VRRSGSRWGSGPRSSSRATGFYLEGAPCLHLAERASYEAHAATLGLQVGAAVDHVAFSGAGYERFAARLEAAGVDAVTHTVPGLLQLFVTDPNGVRVEVNIPD
jgi:hypothetical protein